MAATVGVCLLVTGTGLMAPAQTQAAGGRALLVGIDDYREDGLDMPPGSSTGDIANLRRVVEQSFGIPAAGIMVLRDAAASRAGILEAFDRWLISGSRPGDHVLFAYSGHGAQLPDQNGDEEDGKDETLVAWDAARGPHGPINMIRDDEIEARLQKLPNRRVTVIIDSCHSGTITRAFDLATGPSESASYIRTPQIEPFRSGAADEDSVRDPGTTIARAIPVGGVSDQTLAARTREENFIPGSANVTVWSAVAAGEVALVDRQSAPMRGVFTNRFTAGLLDNAADRNGNGLVSHAELLDYLRRESLSYCQGAGKRDCRANSGHLTPTLEAPADYIGRDVASLRTAPTIQSQATDTLVHGNATDGAGTGANSGTGAGSGTASAGATGAVGGAGGAGGGGDTRTLRLELLPGSRVHLGQAIRFKITSTQPGHLLVIDFDADGKVTQIFPNRFSEQTHRSGRVDAGRPVVIPDASYGFEFIARPPTGAGMVLALITQDEISLDSLADPSHALQPQERPQQYLSDIARALINTLPDRLSARGVRWSMGRAEYRIDR